MRKAFYSERSSVIHQRPIIIRLWLGAVCSSNKLSIIDVFVVLFFTAFF